MSLSTAPAVSGMKVMPSLRAPRSLDGPGAWLDVIRGNPAVMLLVDPRDGRIVEASDSAAVFYGYSRDQLLGMWISEINLETPDQIARRMAEAAKGPATRFFRFRHRLVSGEVRSVHVYAGPMRFRGRTVLQSVIHDVTELAAAEDERDTLAAAAQNAADAIVITDPDANITYVNAAFERASGYSRAEVVGKNPRMLQSGRQSRATYDGMWAALAAGQTWRGELGNRRKDGTEYTTEASIAPVLAEDGTVLHYVGYQRDVTVAREVQARLDKSNGERAAITAMLATLVPGETPERTARSICDRMLTLADVRFASIAIFEFGDRLRSLAAVGRDRVEIPSLIPTGVWAVAARRRTRQLREGVAHGTMREVWTADRPSAMAVAYARLGVAALAAVPLHVGDDVIGFVQIGAGGVDALQKLEPSLPILEIFGAVSSMLLDRNLRTAHRAQEDRQFVERVIAHSAFRPVFQPIVALASGRVVGFEALTRFADGTPPDQRFAAAARVGLGAELEAATLEAAITQSTMLPASAFLNLNISAAFLEDPSRLAYLIWKAKSRSIVLEITEHDQIDDYDRLRDNLSELGAPVRIAVDDAGAGFSSLRHILELRPDFIKLDRALVTRIDVDRVRQGLVAGLQHFAEASGASIIAEGIETIAERDAVSALGVDLGQGYLLGKPAAVADVRGSAGNGGTAPTPARRP